MSYRAIYAYPWDIAETGVSAAIDRFLALGLDTVTITGSYHAGKFLRPHGKGGKVYFPEDGTIYFKPDLSRYGAIKPVENAMLASGHDVVRELVGQSRMATNVWLVLLHNTRLGLLHPEFRRRQRLRRSLRLQSVPFGARSARLCGRPRPRRHRILSRQRRVAGDAGISPLRAWLPS